MSGLDKRLAEIMAQATADLEATDKAREKVLPLCRQVIRHSSHTIRALHRQEFDDAATKLEAARQLLAEAEKAVKGYPELKTAGFFKDAQKEFTEASATLALVKDEPLPSHKELGVEAAAYLNGLGEAVGELRRYLLDKMRHGDLSQGEGMLTAMDDIYSVLVSIDYPDAITGGLRRTTDVFRGVLEKTRSDLTLAMQQKGLEDRLDKFEGVAQRKENT